MTPNFHFLTVANIPLYMKRQPPLPLAIKTKVKQLFTTWILLQSTLRVRGQ